MLSEQLSTDMDRITQLQDAILDLLTLTHTSIEYITTRTSFISPSPTIPRTTRSINAAPKDEYRAAIQTFVSDIVRRSKDLEMLIASLPTKDDSASRELQSEVAVANADYKDALAEAETLLVKVQKALHTALDSSAKDDPALEPVLEELRNGVEALKTIPPAAQAPPPPVGGADGDGQPLDSVRLQEQENAVA